jgi:hypothetical protein
MRICAAKRFWFCLFEDVFYVELPSYMSLVKGWSTTVHIDAWLDNMLLQLLDVWSCCTPSVSRVARATTVPSAQLSEVPTWSDHSQTNGRTCLDVWKTGWWWWLVVPCISARLLDMVHMRQSFSPTYVGAMLWITGKYPPVSWCWRQVGPSPGH